MDKIGSTRLRFCALAAAIAIGIGAAERARAEGCFASFDNFAGLGAGITPAFPGADEYEVTPFFDACLTREEHYIEIQGTTGRIQISPLSWLHGGPVFTYRFGRDRDEVEDELAQELASVDDTIEAGGFLEIREQNVLSGYDSLALRAEGVEDVSDGYGGFLATASVIYRRRWAGRLETATQISGTYMSEEYADAYFSVPTDGVVSPSTSMSCFDSGPQSDPVCRNVSSSARHPVVVSPGGVFGDPFEAGEGFRDVGVLTSVTLHISQRWSVTGNADVKYFVEDAADSPNTEVQGDRLQLTAGATFNVKF